MNISATLKLLAVVAVLLFVDGSARAQCFDHQTRKVTAYDGADDDAFGQHVCVRGNRAIVGAYWHTDGIANTGAAYIFRHEGAEWVFQQELIASDGESADQFGLRVALAGDFALVAAMADDDMGNAAGAVYVFHFDGTSWTEVQKLHASDATPDANFGFDLALENNVALIGAPGGYDNSLHHCGSAYVFRYDGVAWVEEQKIFPAQGSAGDDFGVSVALDSNTALVGSYGHHTFRGTAYVFQDNGSTWTQTQQLLASDGADGDYFGEGVALLDNVAAISAHGDDDAGDSAGAAYVFRHNGSTWVEEQKLIPDAAAAGDFVGRNVAVGFDQVLVSAHGDDNVANNAGAAYLFRFDGSMWQEELALTASDGALADFFGASVSLSGTTALIGAYQAASSGGLNTGAAYFCEVAGLGLDAEPETVAAGDTLNLSTCGGLAGGLAMLVVVDIGGSPLFVRVVIGTFGSGGLWSLAAQVPPGLSGLVITFQSFGTVKPFIGAASNREVVSFQ